MSGPTLDDYRSRLRDALTAIKQLRGEIETLQRANSQPLAIVGMACRFPQRLDNAEALWNGLRTHIDVIDENKRLSQYPSLDSLPASRWAGLLNEIEFFDAAFFDMSPREAAALDPQQRLLLEVTWEALEDAGQLPTNLNASKTGVFIGATNLDYQDQVVASGFDQVDAYALTGNLLSTASGRISYLLGLQGPCMTIDTACSSSLVALHLASRSLRIGESDMTIVGGVNILLSPHIAMMLAKSNALSVDGRCKTFDAAANGYVRSEGCGVLILKRLADAQRDGDRIWAIVRGSAVNQDGRSTGLTTPNVLAQQNVIRQALTDAGLSASDVSYVEAHGTGTPLGDPIEMDALKTVYGLPRADGQSLVVGALKTNVGHLESASGVAGIIKTVLALDKELIPRNNHFKFLNPRIRLEQTRIVIASREYPWPRQIGQPRRAGVSSFGISGTNAHVIVEEAPQIIATERDSAIQKLSSPYLLPISGKTKSAVHDRAHAFCALLNSAHDISLLDITYTACRRRTHHRQRLAAVGQTREELISGLMQVLKDETSAVSDDGALESRPKLVFVFSGQGAQWLGMGRQLYETNGPFQNTLDACSDGIKALAGWNLIEELYANESTSNLAETRIAQPMLFAIQVALVALMRSWGITPDAVIGHSMGEVAAAHVAGILTLEDSLRLITIRGETMQKATGLGKMVSVSMPRKEAESLLAGREHLASIGAVNDPTSVVFSGDESALRGIIAEAENLGFASRPLPVNYAFHSPQMEGLAAEFVSRLGVLQTQPNTITMFSTLSADSVDKRTLDGEYWERNMRQPVDFCGAIYSAVNDGFRCFVEIGPHPVLAANITQCLKAQDNQGLVTFAMRRNRDARQTLLEAMGALYMHGFLPEWQNLLPPGGKTVGLPSYPWQRERYWIESPSAQLPSSPIANSPEPDLIGEYFYYIDWQASSSTSNLEAQPSLRGWYLIFMDAQGVGAALTSQFGAQGHACVKIRSGQSFATVQPNEYTINIENRADYVLALRQAFGREGRCLGIIYLFPLDGPISDQMDENSLNGALARGILGATYLIQAVTLAPGRTKPPLWLATRGAISTNGEPVTSPIHASLWGLCRTVALEHPEITCKCIDLDAQEPMAIARTIATEILITDDENQIAIRAEKRFVARLVRANMAPSVRKESHWKADATYLITGGLGGLGMAVARWMVETGAKHIVLLSRREPNEQTREAIQRLTYDNGANVIVFAADVAKYSDLARAFETMKATMPPLRGIIHAAGVLGEATPLLDLRKETFFGVCTSKINGAWNLHSLSKNLPLDFFIFYSSASAALGLIGHAAYSAANAFMDGLAEWRASMQLPALSIQWGSFDTVGMGSNKAAQERRARGGMISMNPLEGISALDRLLEHPRTNIAIMNFVVRRWLEMFPQLAGAPYFNTLQTTAASSSTKDQRDAQDLLRNIEAAHPDARMELLVKFVRQVLGQVLRLEPERIGLMEPFQSFGIDSLMSLEIRNLLESKLGIKLPATLLFTYPNLKSLAENLLQSLCGEANESQMPPTNSGHIVEDLAELEKVEGSELLDLLDAEMALARGGTTT